MISASRRADLERRSVGSRTSSRRDRSPGDRPYNCPGQVARGLHAGARGRNRGDQKAILETGGDVMGALDSSSAWILVAAVTLLGCSSTGPEVTSGQAREAQPASYRPDRGSAGSPTASPDERA